MRWLKFGQFGCAPRQWIAQRQAYCLGTWNLRLVHRHTAIPDAISGIEIIVVVHRAVKETVRLGQQGRGTGRIKGRTGDLNAIAGKDLHPTISRQGRVNGRADTAQLRRAIETAVTKRKRKGTIGTRRKQPQIRQGFAIRRCCCASVQRGGQIRRGTDPKCREVETVIRAADRRVQHGCGRCLRIGHGKGRGFLRAQRSQGKRGRTSRNIPDNTALKQRRRVRTGSGHGQHSRQFINGGGADGHLPHDDIPSAGVCRRWRHQRCRRRRQLCRTVQRHAHIKRPSLDRADRQTIPVGGRAQNGHGQSIKNQR